MSITMIAVFALIAIIFAVFPLLIYPVLAFIDCVRNPNLSTKSKIAWALLIFFTWTLGAVVYGIAISKRPFYLYGGVAILILLILSILARGPLKNLEKSASRHQTDAKGVMNLASLGVIRASLAIHYGDTVGKYPSRVEDLIGKDGFQEVPKLTLADHPETRETILYGGEVCSGPESINGTKIQDSGKWGYVSDPKAACYGQAFIDCTHVRQLDNKPWYQH